MSNCSRPRETAFKLHGQFLDRSFPDIVLVPLDEDDGRLQFKREVIVLIGLVLRIAHDTGPPEGTEYRRCELVRVTTVWELIKYQHKIFS